MFILPRSLFAFILLVLAGIFVFFNFYGALSRISSYVSRHMRADNISSGVIPAGNNYTVYTRKKSQPDSISDLPDISRYTVDKVVAQSPRFSPGKVAITGMAGIPAMREFIKKDGRVQRLRLSQRSANPRMIFIQDGHYDFTHLYQEIQSMTADNIIQKIGRKYLLRVPVLVGENASLTISGADTDELMLSKEQSVLIANAGDLFILRTKITGWSEKNNAPSFFHDKRDYRPFIVSWSGGRMHIAGSSISNLGYRKGKSYGITFSTCDPCLQAHPGLPRPTGVITGSTFSDMYFGFYSYEADDVAIVGNKYIDNAVYGIDPHDRSRRLIIAGNEAYGSKKKHGIIISRNVNDSWIFNNNCHHNHGSGIMIDRSSENNVIANNISAHNGGDGITFFESQNNTLYGNEIYKNAMSGIRIRNSWNIRLVNDQITDNGRVPVVLYSAKLEESQKERDFKADPYTKKAGADFSGTIIKLTDGKAAFKIDSIDSLAMSNINILSSGAIFSGHMFPDETAISANMSLPQKVTRVVNNAVQITD